MRSFTCWYVPLWRLLLLMVLLYKPFWFHSTAVLQRQHTALMESVILLSSHGMPCVATRLFGSTLCARHPKLIVASG